MPTERAQLTLSCQLNFHAVCLGHVKLWEGVHLECGCTCHESSVVLSDAAPTSA